MGFLRKSNGELTPLGRVVRKLGFGRLAYLLWHLPKSLILRLTLPDTPLTASVGEFTLTGPPPKRNPFSKAMHLTGTWEPEVTAAVRRVVKPGMCVVDVGADIGYYVLLCSSLNQCGRVFAFEPNPAHREHIKRNVLNNNLNAVTLLPCGLGASRAELSFDINAAMMKAETAGSAGLKADIYTFDQLPEELTGGPVPKVDFVLIDVEGYEHEVLKGMAACLRRDRPLVLVELHGPLIKEFASSNAALIQWMSELGYGVEWIDGAPLSADGYSHALFSPATYS